MTFLCPNAIRCPGGQAGSQTNTDYDFPLVNRSSEAPDAPLFVGISYGTVQGNTPAAGTVYDNPATVGVCVTTAQLESDLCATQTQVNNQYGVGSSTGASGDGTSGAGSSNYKNPDQSNTQTYWNTTQSCSYTCKNGAVVTETTPAHTYQATSQALANKLAYNAACKAVSSNKCPPLVTAKPASQYCCVGDAISTITVNVSGTTNATVTAPGLPAGLSMKRISLANYQITGSPASTGEQAIAVTATDAKGNTAVGTAKIIVAQITTDSLPSAFINEDYGAAALAQKGLPDSAAVWSINPGFGTLPDGLSLDTGGTIAGAATTMGHYRFMVVLANGLCNKFLEIEVMKRSSGVEVVNCGNAQYYYVWNNGHPMNQNWLSGSNQMYLAAGGSWDFAAAKVLNLGQPMDAGDHLTLTTDPAGQNVVWRGTVSDSGTGRCPSL